ncbi:class II aldolase/adducin family protein [Pacificoceanicola onchidii]|uniref:class II aldolase/adducin family protein n=1 Tax=Pacificoceanicola onchidii TaxID=2562685 RepID=UPI0010A5E8C3|nr:class II aldolase/adducin family protein [Pacificoceanicola onchidii]
MSSVPDLLTPAFRALSARLGQDPLQVQGPGGNTSIKAGSVMWIKASGTELADAERSDIFVAVDRDAAKAEAAGAGDGSCKATALDPALTLRPSIETTFHAALDHAVVAHSHSVATLVHAISPEGRMALDEKLTELPFVRVPYAKPGLPLTREILARVTPETRIIILQNHGLICCGATVEEVSDWIAKVETLLAMPARGYASKTDKPAPPRGFSWAEESWLGREGFALATGGSYYPDHVVFLGPALPAADHDGTPPAIAVQGEGVLLRNDATPSQRSMLRCLADVLARLPEGWHAEAIGAAAEAELLNWDAEKYRQALAAKP